MAWNSYGLDRIAQKLVLDAKERDSDSLNQSYKMRMAVAYGLERFWGEHLRLQKKEPNKSKYWKETWDALEQILEKAGVNLPNDRVSADNTKSVKAMSEKLWNFGIDEQLDSDKDEQRNSSMEKQRIAIAVLTQLCDSIVWWTQRYKG